MSDARGGHDGRTTRRSAAAWIVRTPPQGGHLDARRAAWFDGLSPTQAGGGTAHIRDPVAEQAALHGLLQRVRDVGLPLLAVMPVEPDQSEMPTGAPYSDPTTAPKETDMVNTVRTAATTRVPMDSTRKTALVAGALYLITFVSIPTLALYSRVLNDRDYIVSLGGDTGVRWGALLELVVALACIGTAVALFPVARRYNEGLALGFVTARVFEAGLIVVGIVSLLSIATLRQDLGAAAGAGAASLAITGRSLVALHNWTFVLGQTLMPGVNALLLGSLLYSSRLVPRIIPALGLIGAPVLISAVVGILFGINEQVSVWTALGTLPIALWEFSLGVWLIAKGFNAAASAAGAEPKAQFATRPA